MLEFRLSCAGGVLSGGGAAEAGDLGRGPGEGVLDGCVDGRRGGGAGGRGLRPLHGPSPLPSWSSRPLREIKGTGVSSAVALDLRLLPARSNGSKTHPLGTIAGGPTPYLRDPWTRARVRADRGGG